MHRSTRALCLIAAFLATWTAVSAIMGCTIDRCLNCSAGICTVCQYGYTVSNNTCVPCPENCLMCSSTGICINCNAGYRFSNSTNGESGFEAAKESTCVAAVSEASCPNSKCMTCDNGLCLQCIPGYFNMDSECYPCAANCHTCSFPEGCTSCNDGYQLSSSEKGSGGVDGTTEGTCEAAIPDTLTTSTTTTAAPTSTTTTGAPTSTTTTAAPTSAPTCTDEHCTICSNGKCLQCASSFFLKDGACASCEAAHCSRCEAAGHCVTCNSGYRMKYLESSDNNITINLWGTCADGAAFTNAYMLVVAVVAIAMTIVAV